MADQFAPFFEEYQAALAAQVAAVAEEERLTEERKRLVARWPGASAAEAKRNAEASADFETATNALLSASKAAAAAKAKVKFLETRWETWRTRESTRRAVMRQKERQHATQETQD